jgi:enterochelin esterase-like enzyme
VPVNRSGEWWRRWSTRGPADRTAIEVSDVLAVRGISPRRASIYLPPGYDPARTRPYPLLLALDGQTMPEWRLEETLQALVTAGSIDPVVVAAVPASADRLDEYGTAGELDFAGRGRLAKGFQELLAGAVLPWVRDHHHVASRPESTGVFGASMGGLCAFDVAWRRPRIFGVAGIFSGSLWWRADNTDVAAQQASRIAHRNVRKARAQPALRLWFEAGTLDEAADRDGNGVIDAIQDTHELMDALAVAGLTRGVEMTYHEVAGGGHSEATWARALPEFLRWAFPPVGVKSGGRPGATHNRR